MRGLSSVGLLSFTKSCLLSGGGTFCVPGTLGEDSTEPVPARTGSALSKHLNYLCQVQECVAVLASTGVCSIASKKDLAARDLETQQGLIVGDLFT